MINRVILVGRLTRDPELRYTPSGVAVATFTVAWRQTAELCAQYLKKGSQTGADGRLQSRSYDDKDGKRVYVTEVVCENVQFLTPSNSENKQVQEDRFKNESSVQINDDDLPF